MDQKDFVFPLRSKPVFLNNMGMGRVYYLGKVEDVMDFFGEEISDEEAFREYLARAIWVKERTPLYFGDSLDQFFDKNSRRQIRRLAEIKDPYDLSYFMSPNKTLHELMEERNSRLAALRA